MPKWPVPQGCVSVEARVASGADFGKKFPKVRYAAIKLC